MLKVRTLTHDHNGNIEFILCMTIKEYVYTASPELLLFKPPCLWAILVCRCSRLPERMPHLVAGQAVTSVEQLRPRCPRDSHMTTHVRIFLAEFYVTLLGTYIYVAYMLAELSALWKRVLLIIFWTMLFLIQNSSTINIFDCIFFNRFNKCVHFGFKRIFLMHLGLLVDWRSSVFSPTSLSVQRRKTVLAFVSV